MDVQPTKCTSTYVHFTDDELEAQGDHRAGE